MQTIVYYLRIMLNINRQGLCKPVKWWKGQ